MSQAGEIDVVQNHPEIPTRFEADVGFAVPIANTLELLGEAVTAGTNPFRSIASGNTVTYQTQISQAVAATDATKIGLSAFDSTYFTVDPNGFVSSSGTGFAETITGDTGGPLSPTSGNWNILGSSSIETDGSGSTLTISTSGTVPISFITDSGTATASASIINVLGGLGASTSGSGNTITVTVSTTGIDWTEVTGATQTLAVNSGYITSRGGGVTYTLPATASLGDTIYVVGKAGLATITPNANQQILIGSASGTVGVTGTAVATNAGDCITLVCTTAGASSFWRAQTLVGSWTLT